MKPTILYGNADDYEEITSFGNLVFDTDFRQLLPNIYDRHPQNAVHHILIREQGKIKAMVGAFPLRMHMAERTLNICGIGTVSVDPEVRGRGYMQLLMQRAVEDARARGDHLMVLGGQRQRYEFFGFSPCGIKTIFSFSDANLRHAPSAKGIEISVQPLFKESPYLEECRILHDIQSCYVERLPADFFTIISNHHATPYVLLYQNKCIGYFTWESGRSMAHEFFISSDDYALPALLAWLHSVKGTAEITLFPYQTALMRAAYLFCERTHIINGPMFQILDYPAVITASLSLKSSFLNLTDGEVVIEIINQGRYKIIVKGGDITVVSTKEPALVTLTHLQMMMYLFSPMGYLAKGAPLTLVEQNWFPLPLFCPRQDEV